MVNKQLIKHNFSRYARHYDEFARLQICAVEGLMKGLPDMACQHILDIGCGTGLLTERLLARFPEVDIRAVDLCPNMIDVAQTKFTSERICFASGDAEVMDLGGPYDLIASNASLQWFNDLEQTLTRCAQALRSGGCLAFSLFGPRTYRELACVLNDVLGEDHALTSELFMSVAEVEPILSGMLAGVRVIETETQETFNSVMDLLRTIKYTGTKGHGMAGRVLQRPQIRALEKAYRERYGEVTVTCHLIYCFATKECA